MPVWDQMEKAHFHGLGYSKVVHFYQWSPPGNPISLFAGHQQQGLLHPLLPYKQHGTPVSTTVKLTVPAIAHTTTGLPKLCSYALDMDDKQISPLLQLSAPYKTLHNIPSSPQLPTRISPSAVLSSRPCWIASPTDLGRKKPDLHLLWEPDWTRIGSPWPLPSHCCLPLIQLTQYLPMSSSYYHYGRTFPRCSKKFACVVQPTTPTMAAKNLLCPP